MMKIEMDVQKENRGELFEFKSRSEEGEMGA